MIPKTRSKKRRTHILHEYVSVFCFSLFGIMLPQSRTAFYSHFFKTSGRRANVKQLEAGQKKKVQAPITFEAYTIPMLEET